MTVAGKSLTWLTKCIGKNEFTGFLWKTASRLFANGASGSAHVFLYGKPRDSSFWITIEKKILEKHSVEIIEHTL